MTLADLIIDTKDNSTRDEVLVYVYTKDGAVIGTKAVSIETESTEDGKVIINAKFNT